MENQTNLPNITSQVMLKEKNLSETKAKLAEKKKDEKNDDYKKNYLNVMLSDGEKEKTLTIRVLPMDLNPNSKTYCTPFAFVHTHNVKVPVEISKSGWKNYLCISKTDGIDHSLYGYKCPFCELRSSAYEAGKNEQDKTKQDALYKISTSNIPRESAILRCIDRDHEDEGVKFWKFNLREDKTDPYHQIMSLWELRMREGERAGVDFNILDIYNGVDLTIKITEGNNAPIVTDCRLQGPVSRNQEQMIAWIYDDKKWQDVFAVKPYEYLKLVSAQKIPWKDSETGLWIDKEEYLKKREQIKRNSELEIQHADSETCSLGADSRDLINSLSVNDSDIPM